MASKKQLTEKLINMSDVDEPAGVVRMDIDDEGIQALASSIAALGMLQAILVRPAKNRYEIIYGHRRFLACRMCGMKRIRATVKELSDVETAMMRATENVERVDISPIEEAATYQNLVDAHNLTVAEVARMMGRSASLIKRRMDLLRMPAILQKAVHNRRISYGVGESLWSLADDDLIEYYLGFAIENGATVATVRQWVRDVADQVRREKTDVAGGGGWKNPNEPVPTYVACELCKQPMELGKETVMRACPVCVGAIKTALGTAP